MKRWVIAVLGSLFVVASLRADVPCANTYEKAKAAIVTARVGRGLEMKLLTKVEDAWRIYRSGKKNARKDALHDLDVALGLLDKNSTKQLPSDVRASVTDAITAFHHCIETGAVTTASLTVRVTRPSIDTPGATVLVAGAIVRVNGVEVATTGASGQVTVDVPAGDAGIDAVVYPMEAASTSVTLAQGTAQTVELRLVDSEPEENTQLVLDEAPDGVLPANFGSFTLRFLDPAGAHVTLRSIEEVQLRRSDGSGWTYWPEAFRVAAADGSLQPVDLASWRTALTNQGGRLELGVSAIDSGGRVHQGSYTFYLGSITVEGHLAAPPSNPALPVGGVPVFASVLNTDVVFRTVTAADGSFTFPALPRGNLELDATSIGADGKTYYGDAVVTLTSNVRIYVNLLYTTDKMNGVPLFRTEPIAQALTPTTNSIQRATGPERARMGSLVFPVALAPVAAAETNSVTVQVFSAAEDVPVTKAATLTVPQGTRSIVLRYRVTSAEYPYYVLANSVYNDWWYLEVTAATNGARLFRRLRQVNSQLTQEPIWQLNGTTGDLQEELDTQTLTQYGAADVTVLAMAENVGDSALLTSVNATLSRNFTVSINFIDHDTVRGFSDRSPHQTHGLSDRFSIPRTGETNYAQRTLTFGVGKPATATVTNVKVFAEGSNPFNPSPLTPNPIVDQAPGGSAVTQDPIDPTRFTVRVTFADTGSPLATAPPPASRLRYRIRVTVDDNGATKSVDRASETYYPLWRMPAGFARYGQPPEGQQDWGGDDWCSSFTYQWLDANRALISSINDISGEHAADTGHHNHYEGREIDVFHYYTFPGITTYATGNYLALARDTARMTSTDAAIRDAARGRVTAWVSAMREHLAALAALYDVERLYTTRGGMEYGVADGWGESLLTTGTCTIGGTAVDLGIGNWSCTKCRYNHVHDNHVHITLSDAFN